MSSSAFVESSSAAHCSIGNKIDSDLVVVYGKKGISFDDKGLENLIEEKTISSISVIRLTSPTPSMENQEIEFDKLAELVRKEELGSSANSETGSEIDTSSEADVQEKQYETDSTDINDLNSSDEDAISSNKEGRNRGRRNSRKKVKSVKPRDRKLKKKRKKDRPEIVALNVEEFYSGQEATDLLKSALKLAGVATIKKTAEHEFMLYVIQNDHNYTPFTSPEQMKGKLASDKIESERTANQQRKVLIQASSVKHPICKKKPERSYKAIVPKPNEDINTSDDEHVEGEEELSGFSGFDESAASDNDRDSDLDFKVTNRRKQKGKVFRKINRNPLISKIISNKIVTQNIAKNEPVDTITSIDTIRSPQIRPGHFSISNSVIVSAPTKYTLIKKSINENKTLPIRTNTCALSKSPASESTLLNNQPSSSTSICPQSPQTIKEIVINKVIASPKGVFTNISELLSDNKPIEHNINLPTTPKSSTTHQKQHSSIQTTPSKGFTPLGVEAAEKNQLPSQISIQTHQSSSEIAAENDKQLDLIDSIVKDEMQKADSIVKENDISSQNIPELVKMLESTESALEPKKTESNNNSAMRTELNKSSADIPNTTILEPTNSDVLPEDLLQHVVDLIEEDRTLKEAVEKQVFGNDSLMESFACRDTINTTPPPLRPIYHKEMQPIISANQINIPESSKSIIQMSITNAPFATLTNSLDPIIQKPLLSPTKSITGITPTLSLSPSTPIKQTSQIECAATPKISQGLRGEPIKIVRGNGRIITLPPIEAPTTRAKRRAQVHPIHQQTALNNSVVNETSLDISMASNTSFAMNDTSLSLSGDKSVLEKSCNDTANKSRSSKESTGEMKNKKKSSASRKSRKQQGNKSRNETEASESQDDDDDPNKLWCICRQPHNNRFMICCDSCEDWFHGTCVNITKAMGIEMEHKGVDWTCPKCVKIQEEKKQPKITEMLIGKKNVTQSEEMNISNEQIITKKEPAEAPKDVTVIKKIQNELKNIQSGQFISLQDLTHSKKSPIHVIQKKIICQSNPIEATNSLSTTSLYQVKSAPPHETKQIIPIHKHLLGKINNHGDHIKLQKAVTMAPISSNPVGETPENCIVCKQFVRNSGVYCSDECINKYVRNVLQNSQGATKSPEPSNLASSAVEEKKRKVKTLFEDLLSMADRKPKVERITVYERKSGRIISGNNAPTIANLKKWLQENPTFEVFLSGSTQTTEIENKPKQKYQHINLTLNNKDRISSSIASSISTATKKETQSSVLGKSEHTDTTTTIDRHMKQQTLVLSRPSTTKQLEKYPQHVAIKPDKQPKIEAMTKDDPSSTKEKIVKRPHSDANINKKLNDSGIDHEPIRLTVRRTLKEQLLLRIKDYKEETNSSDGTSTEKHKNYNHENERRHEINTIESFTAEVENFAYNTEIEMYRLFNQDTGTKYRAKYRSLMFNIKDRKNRTLFTKICSKLINPEQLVRMSPDELASQELAQWRENEAKHQLEIIKKSELDLLACTKNYVLKTHKGEELIEEKTVQGTNIDFKIPVEDVFTMLNSTAETDIDNSQESISSARRDFTLLSDYDMPPSFIESPTTTVKDEEIKLKNRHKENERDRGRYLEHDVSHKIPKSQNYERKHSNKSHHKSKTRYYKRNRSHSRSRSRSREKRYKGYSHKDEFKDNGNNGKGKLKEEYEKKDKKSIQALIAHSTSQDGSRNIVSKKEKRNSTKKANTQKPLEAFNLIDQILESSKTVEEAANLVGEKDKDLRKNTSNVTTPYSLTTDNDQEPTSTVSIATPPQDPYNRYYGTNSPLLGGDPSFIWNGTLHMIDVTSFHTTLQSFSGQPLNFFSYMPKSLEVVGRISPDTVWDYVSKIKKSPNKEIVLIRLLPSNEAETSAYIELYQYLHIRKRLGVIKTTSLQLRDFYIYPLDANKKMPTVFQMTTDEEEFFNDPMRPDILIGIIIKVLGKRRSPGTVILSSVKTSNTKYSRSITSDSSNPLDSPKRKKHLHSSLPKGVDIDIDAIIKAPIVLKSQKVNPSTPSILGFDANEPYSPGGSSDSDIQVTEIQNTADTSKSEEELKRKMDELNRQIAVQEMEIAGLLNVDHSVPTATSTSKVLANISIPPDLSQILASIRTNPNGKFTKSCNTSYASSRFSVTAPSDEYDPEEAYTSNSIQKPSTSRLAQLSEAELLMMVPDDIIIEKRPTNTKGTSDEPPPPGVA